MQAIALSAAMLLSAVLAVATARAQPAAPAAAAPAKVERDAAPDPAAAARLSEVGKGDRLGRKALQPGAYIGERHRANVRAWYASTYGPGKGCPPGVTKKSGACTTPAAASWRIGEPLPRGALPRGLPRELLAQLPPQPPGTRYVQVAGDILLISNPSQMVVDAIGGLLKM